MRVTDGQKDACGVACSVRSRSRTYAGVAGCFVLGGAAIGTWNPWHLDAVGRFDHPLLAGFVVPLLFMAWLTPVRGRRLERIVGLVVLSVVLVADVAAASGLALFATTPCGEAELPIPETDVRVVVEEWGTAPGRRFDTVTLASSRGLASRQNRIGSVRVDLTDAAVDVSSGTVVLRECRRSTTIVFDPDSLTVVSTAVAVIGAEHPEGALQLPFRRRLNGENCP